MRIEYAATAEQSESTATRGAVILGQYAAASAMVRTTNDKSAVQPTIPIRAGSTAELSTIPIRTVPATARAIPTAGLSTISARAISATTTTVSTAAAYDAPPTPPKKKSRKGLIIGVIVLVVALTLCGAIGSALSHGASAVTSTTDSSKIGNTTNATPTTIPTQATNYKVGDVVNVGNAWDVTVVSAKADQGNTVFQPKSGMQYLVISLAMKNLTTENHTISSLIQFTLRSDDGTKYNVALYAPDGSSQIDGDVDGGQPAKGVISYEVPTNVHSFHLTFENVLASGRATWNLTI